MTFTMFDSVTISEIPSSATAVAGYVGGNFPTFSRLAADFPKARRLSVAVNAGEDAECLDIEAGDAVPSQAPAWFERQRGRGVARPCFYANASTMPSVIATLSAAGIKRPGYRIWVAHFTDVAHLEPGSDATQWTQTALGRNLDQSLCVDNFLDELPTPKPVVNPMHYDWFDAKTRNLYGDHYNERALVQRYDKLRKHGVVNRERLAPIRRDLLVVADRVLAIALTKGDKGQPNWKPDHLGWRRRQLINRVQGERFV